MLDVLVVLLRTSEVQVSHHSTHRAEWCVVRELLDKVQWQYTREHTYLVNVTRQHVCRGVLVYVGGTQCNVVVAVDTTQTVGSKRFHEFLVQINISHVLRTRYRHSKVVPVAIARTLLDCFLEA